MSKQVNASKIARTEANKRVRAVRHQQRMAAQANKQLTIARGATRSARRARQVEKFPVDPFTVLMQQAVSSPHYYKLSFKTYNKLKAEGYAVG